MTFEPAGHVDKKPEGSVCKGFDNNQTSGNIIPIFPIKNILMGIARQKEVI